MRFVSAKVVDSQNLEIEIQMRSGNYYRIKIEIGDFKTLVDSHLDDGLIEIIGKSKEGESK